MRHLTLKYDGDIYSGTMYRSYFGGLKAGVLDIETTGLDPARNKFILGGLLDIQTKTVHQIFAESRSEERETLRAFADLVSGLDMVITYNGRHFDMPFINRRLAAFSAGSCRPYDLDIYQVVNGHSPIRKFVPNLKQKTLESYMGLWQSRTDEISGAESVELYDRYEKSGDEELARRILLHNSDDVVQLTRLMRVLEKSDLHRAMFHLGFPAGPLNVERIRLSASAVTVTGRQRSISADYSYFSLDGSGAEIRLDSRRSDFYLSFPIIRNSGIAVADLEALGLDSDEFDVYPTFGSGFLVLEDHDSRNYMEINHLIRSFIKGFISNI